MTKLFSPAVLLFACLVLGSQVAAQHAVKGEFPKDLLIKVFHGYGEAGFSQLTIDSAGTIRSKSYSNMPRSPRISDLYKKKTPKLKNRLSKAEIREIISAFEISGFFSMNNGYSGDPDIQNATCSTHSDSKSLSIVIGGQIKSVGFDLGCPYGEAFLPLRKFLTLYDAILEKTKGVKKNPL